tara:strand:- start:652 stop:1260 length:609 start_codon:yes stop_codon:yes gene_type:complete
MAKGKSDLILRDRLQFSPDAGGNQETVYGRFDLSEYVSTLERKGLAIKEVNLMLREPTAGNCGNFEHSQGTAFNASTTGIATQNLKIYCSTRAYENAADVGIASPDVIHIETFTSYLGPQFTGGAAPIANSTFMYADHNVYPTENLHPDGFPVVTDLLFAVSSDNWTLIGDKVIELDVMLIAEPITISAKELTEMLVQGQDQ